MKIGIRDYGGNSLGGVPVPSVGDAETDINYLLAQKLLVEKQKSVPNPGQHWPGGDPLPILSPSQKQGTLSGTSSIFSKLLPPMEDSSRQVQPQKVDLLSMLKSSSDKPPQSPMQAPVTAAAPGPTPGFPLWSGQHEGQNPPGAIPMQPNLHASPQIPRFIPQQNQQLQLPQLGPHLFSEISQDPQMLGLLQQHYLQAQMQLHQTPVAPPAQLSLMDKFLLLKQQQQQQLEQQQLILQQQQQQLQQQQLLSHVSLQQQQQKQQQQLLSQVSLPKHIAVPMADPQLHGAGFSGIPVLQAATPIQKELPASPSPLSLPHQNFDPVSVTNSWGVPPVAADKPTDEAKAFEVPLDDAIQQLADDDFWGPSDISARIDDKKICGGNDDYAPEQTEQGLLSGGLMKEMKTDTKKTSEKKSKKQKSSKKGASAKQGTEAEGSGLDSTWSKPVAQNDEIDLPKYELSVPATKALETEFDRAELEPEVNELHASSDTHQAISSARVWKATPGLRPKSLKEIQAEEALRAKREAVLASENVAAAAVTSPLPWANATSEFPPIAATARPVPMSDFPPIAKGKKGAVHDVLVEEVLTKSSELEKDPGTSKEFTTLPPPSPMLQPLPTPAQAVVDDDDFIEAKESKKSRKKSKAKNSNTKAAPVPLDVSAYEKNKGGANGTSLTGTARQTAQQEELPAPPAGPSLGDFLPFKADSSIPAPAWSSDSGKLQKKLSFKQIQKEQEKVPVSVPVGPVQAAAPTKVQPSRGSAGGSTWNVYGSSPSKVAPLPASSPVQMSAGSSAQTKAKTEEDFFWGPLDHSKQDSSKQYVLCAS